MIIKEVKAEKIKTSTGKDTIQVTINKKYTASAPLGTSTGKHEVKPFPAKGVDFCAKYINNLKELRGMSFENFNDLNHVEKYSDILNGNSVLALQFAILKAMSNNEVHKFLNPNADKMPVPLGNVIGGGDWSDDRLIADIMKSLMANKTAMIRNPRAIRPWQHVLEPLSGYLILAENLFHDAKTYGEAWNFGPYTHDAATVKEIVKKIYSRWQEKNAGWTYQCDSKSAHEATFLKLDISKASSKLQWKPRLNLETTINWVVNWYQAHAIKNNMQEFTINQIQQYQTLMKNEV